MAGDFQPAVPAQAPAEARHPAFHQQDVEHPLGGVAEWPVVLAWFHTAQTIQQLAKIATLYQAPFRWRSLRRH
jgi:hypothetical protein